MAQVASLSLSKRSMPSREGTGNCVTTSAATRLAASGWLFIEDSLEEETRPLGAAGLARLHHVPGAGKQPCVMLWTGYRLVGGNL
ncbi:hypothetical protein RK21_04683 [Pseudomonas plecoglossicida]|nr:hypothetical protein RK21_04683 [Pseudomonas plecoglossicida]GJB83606.1 hypothetical protein KAM380_080710 [Aeromonas caviae]